MNGARRSERGITLIELVVAMALFGLVAVMGLQALTGTLRLRDRLVQVDDRNSGLSLGLTLMRSDLSAALPLLFFPPGGGTPRSSLDLSRNGQVLGLSAGAQPDLPPVDAGGFHRIEWRFDPATKTMTRRVWPILYPQDADAAEPWVTYLTGVTGLRVRTHWPGFGWVAGTRSGAPASPPAGSGGGDGDTGPAVAEGYSDQLPNAVELTLETDTLGRIVLLETFR